MNALTDLTPAALRNAAATLEDPEVRARAAADTLDVALALRTEANRREFVRGTVLTFRPPAWLQDAGTDFLYGRSRGPGADAGLLSVDVMDADVDRLMDAAPTPEETRALARGRYDVPLEDLLTPVVRAEDVPDWMGRLSAGVYVAHQDSVGPDGYLAGEEGHGPSSVAEVSGWTVIGFPDVTDGPRLSVFLDGEEEPIPFPAELVVVEREHRPMLGHGRSGRWLASPEERARLAAERLARDAKDATEQARASSAESGVPVSTQAWKRGEEGAPEKLLAVEYTVYTGGSQEGDGERPRKITLWVGLDPDQGAPNVDAGSERLQAEGLQVSDWAAA